MSPQQCEADRTFPGGYRVRSWSEAKYGSVDCDVALGGPVTVQVVEVSCTRVRHGRTIQIRGAVATPPPHNRAVFFAVPPRLDWMWSQPLKVAPVEARSPMIVHVCPGRQNIGVEVEVTDLLQPRRRVDDGTIEITVTLC